MASYLDKLYGYNALNELTGSVQGTLNSQHTAITANQNQTEAWTLDGMGDWSNYTQTVGGSTTVDQDRDTNALNEITDYNSTSLCAGARLRCRREHDHYAPARQRNDRLDLRNDAWNRLVEVESGSPAGHVFLWTDSIVGTRKRRTVRLRPFTTTVSPLPPAVLSRMGRGAGGEGDQVLGECCLLLPSPSGRG